MIQHQFIKPISPGLTKVISALVVVLLLGLFMPAFAQAYSIINAQPLLLGLASQQPDQPVSVIVQKTVPGDALEKQVAALGGAVTNDLSFINSFVAELPAGQVPFLASRSGVRWVSFDAPVVKTACDKCMPADDPTNYTSAVNADKVWNNSNGKDPWLQGQGIGVAIMDSSVNPNLPDFSEGIGPASRVISSVKIDKNSPSIDDGNGHGTLVAGVIGSNGRGSSGKNPGIAPQARLVNVKISDDTGASSAADVLAGLQWVYQNAKKYNIRVINLSINSSIAQSYNVDPLNAGVEALWFSGITVVVSAGNNGTANLFAPANDPYVITVGAATNSGTADAPAWAVAPFSAYGTDELGGSKPDLVAPGTGIISNVATSTALIPVTHKDKLLPPPPPPPGSSSSSYMKVAGTSFAAPQVTGAVALLLQSNPNLTPDQVKYRLKATALKNVPQGAWDKRTLWDGYDATRSGAGFLDIQAAVTQTGLNGKANTGAVPSKLLMSVLVEFGVSPVPASAVNYSSVNWSSVNWSSVNWSSVNWSSVNWSSVNWSSVNWSSVNWSSVNWSSVNWSGIYWGDY